MQAAISAVRQVPEEQSWQTPWLQACCAPQVSPQAPQFLGSVAMLVQTPLQMPCPTGHTQAAAMQTFPPLQAAPQEPQLLLSLSMATQVSPQRTVPVVH